MCKKRDPGAVVARRVNPRRDHRAVIGKNLNHRPVEEEGEERVGEIVVRADVAPCDQARIRPQDMAEPVASIKNLGRLIEQVGPLNDNQKMYLKGIVSATNSIDEQVNKLLVSAKRDLASLSVLSAQKP